MIHPVQKDLFAVIGNPVGHSLSPAMMNTAFQSLGVPAVYLALQADALEEDLETLSRMGLRGLSVTIPHKETAFRLARSVDETAREIGAVNTLRRIEGGWEGCNTDWIGSNRALSGGAGFKGKQAVVLGAGGAARAVVYGLIRGGATVTVANRSPERGRALADAFGCAFLPLGDLQGPGCGREFDIVVQCTPVGLMNEGAPPVVPSSFFHSGMVVLDTVYRPLLTPFLRTAKGTGATIVSGIEMLLHQGVAQLEWWLGRTVPQADGVRVMRDALLGALADEDR